MSSDPFSPLGDSALHRTVSGAGERIQEILDAAERAAETIKADAEAAGAELIEQRRQEAAAISEQRDQADALAEALEQVRQTLERQLADLHRRDEAIIESVEAAIGALGGVVSPSISLPTEPAPAARTLEAEAESPQVDAPATSPPPERVAEPHSRPTVLPPSLAPIAFPGTAQRSAGSNDPEARQSALIRATQLAVRGTERSEIEAALSAEFGVSQPAEIVDEILGTG